jgi:hypothetical protein
MASPLGSVPPPHPAIRDMRTIPRLNNVMVNRDRLAEDEHRAEIFIGVAPLALQDGKIVRMLSGTTIER